MSSLDDLIGCLGCTFDLWLLPYLLPLAAIGLGIWYLLDPNYLAGGLWIGGGLILAWFIYFRRKRVSE